MSDYLRPHMPSAVELNEDGTRASEEGKRVVVITARFGIRRADQHHARGEAVIVGDAEAAELVRDGVARYANPPASTRTR